MDERQLVAISALSSLLGVLAYGLRVSPLEADAALSLLLTAAFGVCLVIGARR